MPFCVFVYNTARLLKKKGKWYYFLWRILLRRTIRTLTIKISAAIMAAGIRRLRELSVTDASVDVSIVVKGLPKEPNGPEEYTAPVSPKTPT